ncbi:transmembrane protein, putative [Medicago truncatula]|uniref:Transmembrane protein, putative n=1 Tax=Medicago truncatula TaxID=3880 RepID=A0A072U1N6_MEDTR|nr:transmembrane protein, putative [Medicago truncatula]
MNFTMIGLNIGSKSGFVLITALIILPSTWLRSLGVLVYISVGGIMTSFVWVYHNQESYLEGLREDDIARGEEADKKSIAKKIKKNCNRLWQVKLERSMFGPLKKRSILEGPKI